MIIKKKKGCYIDNFKIDYDLVLIRVFMNMINNGIAISILIIDL